MNVENYASKLNDGKLKTKTDDKKKSSVERYAEKHIKPAPQDTTYGTHKVKSDRGQASWMKSALTEKE